MPLPVQHGATSRIAEYHEHVPSPRLAPLVERATGYRISGFPAGVHVGMPSGSVTLVVALDEPLVLSGPGEVQRRFASVLAGLSTGPAHIHHHGNQHGIQLALRPGAVRLLFGCRAADLSESSFELHDVMGERATRLRDRLHEIHSWTERFEVLEEELLRSLTDRWEPDPEVGEAWRVIRASGGSLRIRDVARSVGWSMRTLQIRFRAEYGVTPKEAARLRRFERSLPLVSSGRMPLSSVALACGFADQAHLNREWLAFAGTSPTRWRRDDVLIGV